jgi:ABC-type glycerol-3-phosphate transport system substrate-binding protein
MLRQFEALHEGITFEIGTYNQSPLNYMRSDPAPDVMSIWSGTWLFDGLREGLLTDLTDIVDMPIDENVPTYQAQLQQQTMQGGRNYFTPVGYHWRGIYYNVSIFDQYGIGPPQSWEQLLDAANTLQANGVIPFVMPRQDEWLSSLWFDYLNMRINGPEFHQALINGQESYTDDRVRDVFVTWQSLFEAGYFTEDLGIGGGFESAMALVQGDANMPLTRQKAAMGLMAPFDLSEVPEIFQNELGVFAFPPFDPNMRQGEIVNAVGYVVPARAENRIQALEFLSYVSSTEIQAALGQVMGAEALFIPATMADVDQLPRVVQSGYNIAAQADIVVLPYFWASPDSMRSTMSQVIGRFVRNAYVDPVDVNDLLLELEDARLRAQQNGDFFQ